MWWYCATWLRPQRMCFHMNLAYSSTRLCQRALGRGRGGGQSIRYEIAMYTSWASRPLRSQMCLCSSLDKSHAYVEVYFKQLVRVEWVCCRHLRSHVPMSFVRAVGWSCLVAPGRAVVEQTPSWTASDYPWRLFNTPNIRARPALRRWRQTYCQ